MRLSALAWRHSTVADVIRAQYDQVHQRLIAAGTLTSAAAATACNTLFHFAALLDDASDLRGFTGTRDDLERIEQSWPRFLARHAWRPRQMRRLRRQLIDASGAWVPAVAVALRRLWRDDARPAEAEDVVYAVERSCPARFSLHDSLPRTVRAWGARDVRYRLVARLTDEMGAHLRNVSQLHLRQVSRFLALLVLGVGANPPGDSPVWQMYKDGLLG